MIELMGNARNVANAIAIAVLERGRPYLIRCCGLPPRLCCIGDWVGGYGAGVMEGGIRRMMQSAVNGRRGRNCELLRWWAVCHRVVRMAHGWHRLLCFTVALILVLHVKLRQFWHRLSRSL
jgi:hypothetical protein